MTLVTIWGLRLSIHLALRNLPKGEDFRYAQWRSEAGASWWWRSFFKVFLLQGLIMWLISTPLLVVQFNALPAHLTALDYLALGLWAIGFFFEAVGDWQLARFKAHAVNNGQLLTTGVWAWTRHPNYFGDGLQWLAFGLFALITGAWWTLYSPLMMNFLLVRVSGVTMLEKSLKAQKPGYDDYMARTSAYIPWIPRSN
jgi:steroid 5-alpha reductase family enzyme